MKAHKADKVYEKYEDKPRDERVKDVFKMLVAGTNAGTRFMMRHGSFLKFQGLMHVMFKTYGGIALTSSEIRKVWDALWVFAKYNRAEKRSQPGLIKQYEVERKTMSHDPRPDEDDYGDGSDMVVESATKGVVH